jgi:hypothetical protein
VRQWAGEGKDPRIAPVAINAKVGHPSTFANGPEHPGLKSETWATHSTFVRAISSSYVGAQPGPPHLQASLD